MTDDDEYTEPMNDCRKCGSGNVSLMTGTALFHGGDEYFVLCFDCAAAGESSYDFGVKADEHECSETAKQFWNAHGPTTSRPSIVALFSKSREAQP